MKLKLYKLWLILHPVLKSASCCDIKYRFHGASNGVPKKKLFSLRDHAAVRNQEIPIVVCILKFHGVSWEKDMENTGMKMCEAAEKQAGSYIPRIPGEKGL
ncbi:uncharacterized protein LOC123553615 [Mercenaria mercenaria]|uniref:uncharacterized protein LOC123553615 n=1 Tax=Mercenaria mercenaria TaxID=6596 RepID=UPI00234E5761|nr:uncharacterized protein LOC123553615 [Mercenaria mercenaria]